MKSLSQEEENIRFLNQIVLTKAGEKPLSSEEGEKARLRTGACY
jgi:hypothetical protein